ncbi:MAG: YggT family protein [Anaerolineae bacterium]|nr:YggT family protein [Anaerolineae bacterium]
MDTVLDGVLKAFDIVLGVLGLLLVIRIVLQIFRLTLPPNIMKVLTAITDPVVNWVGQVLGLKTSPYIARINIGVDVLSMLATVVMLWVAHTLVSWAFDFAGLLVAFILNPLGSIGPLLIFMVRLLFDLYGIALLLRVVFEWLHISYAGRLMQFLWNITEPVLAPIRRVIPTISGWDFSPVVAVVAITLLQRIVLTMLGWIF